MLHFQRSGIKNEVSTNWFLTIYLTSLCYHPVDTEASHGTVAGCLRDNTGFFWPVFTLKVKLNSNLNQLVYQILTPEQGNSNLFVYKWVTKDYIQFNMSNG